MRIVPFRIVIRFCNSAMTGNKPKASEEDEWLNEDGTAKDPEKYKAMLRSDPERWKSIEENPETAAIILGDDIDAFQELLKSAVEVGRCVWCTASS